MGAFEELLFIQPQVEVSPGLPGPGATVTLPYQSFHFPKPALSSGKVWKVPSLGPWRLDFTSASPSSLLAKGHGFPEPNQAQTALRSPHLG